MKKYLIAVLLVMNSLTADAAWHTYPDAGCAVQVWVWPWHKGRDDYYFCGAHKAICNNDLASTDEISNSVKWYNHKGVAVLNGSQYRCCDGQVNGKPSKKGESATGTPGRWVKGDKWYIEETPKTKVVNGATCSYVEKKDICGNITPTEAELEKLCTKQKTDENVSVTCPDGQYWRDSAKACATLCGDGQAYESEKSNKCVDCSETLHQGISCSSGKCGYVIEPEDKICRKCYSNAFFDPVTRNCVEKSNLVALSTSDLQYGLNETTRKGNISAQCWTKYGSEYEKCVKTGLTSSKTDVPTAPSDTTTPPKTSSGTNNGGGNGNTSTTPGGPGKNNKFEEIIKEDTQDRIYYNEIK